MPFLQPLDEDIKQAVFNQIRELWTHYSTALEGNTLTLGDTNYLLSEGLTISGKPIKDHQEVIGHANAIDTLYQSLSQPLTQEIVFALHRAVQTEIVSDIYKTQGAWKLEPNGTYTVDAEGQQQFIQYALPAYVPALMDEFINTINAIDVEKLTIQNATACYAKLHMGFVHIHPFWDGNGRMARLLANIPLLKAGLPPLLIATDARREYIECLAHYQLAVGQINHQTGIWPQAEKSSKKLHSFTTFCEKSYQSTKDVIEKAFLEQEKRQASS